MVEVVLSAVIFLILVAGTAVVVAVAVFVGLAIFKFNHFDGQFGFNLLQKSTATIFVWISVCNQKKFRIVLFFWFFLSRKYKRYLKDQEEKKGDENDTEEISKSTHN